MRDARMTCRRFERQVSDWLGRRLPPEHSEQMAHHQQSCAPCSRAAQAEADLRQCFREAAPPVLPELWPRLASCLEAEVPKTSLRRSALSPQRWAIAGAVALVALIACWSHLPGGIGAEMGRAAGVEKTLPAQALTASSAGPISPRQALAWPQLGNAAQDDPAVDDPAVDDPVGPNIETIWTCLNMESK